MINQFKTLLKEKKEMTSSSIKRSFADADTWELPIESEGDLTNLEIAKSRSPHAGSSFNEVDANVARCELMVRFAILMCESLGEKPPGIKKTLEEDLFRSNSDVIKRMQ